MRLSAYISQNGITSRREAEALIKQGLVTVNGMVAKSAITVYENDKVSIKGKTIKKNNKKVYIALNKPVGITCTTERQIEGNIVDFVHHKERIFPIGRLDKDSEGLILLTNDGDIVNRILWSDNNHEKEYIVTIDKTVTKGFLSRMSKGIKILDVMTKPCVTWQIKDKSFGIILTQGLNRQIRRMCSHLGFQVKKLKRVRIMNIELNNMKTGEWRNLDDYELEQLLKTIKVG